MEQAPRAMVPKPEKARADAIPVLEPVISRDRDRVKETARAGIPKRVQVETRAAPDRAREEAPEKGAETDK